MYHSYTKYLHWIQLLSELFNIVSKYVLILYSTHFNYSNWWMNLENSKRSGLLLERQYSMHKEHSLWSWTTGLKSPKLAFTSFVTVGRLFNSLPRISLLSHLCTECYIKERFIKTKRAYNLVYDTATTILLKI